MNVTKREIYKKFGKNGYISDVFFSRKVRKRTSRPFAFVRFHSHEGAIKTIGIINETTWEDSKLFATLARSRRDRGMEETLGRKVTKRTLNKKWVVVKSKDSLKTNAKKDDKQMVCSEEKRRHEVEAIWCEDQKQRLTRSLLGVSVKFIEFRKMMYKLLEEWKRPGSIECRDVGPYRCLITFDTLEIRDAVLEDELLLSTFDEVRRHWEFFWGLSKRVWIEIMGLPIGLWCTENINRIVEHWGKVVRFDDRTEELKSFSTASRAVNWAGPIELWPCKMGAYQKQAVLHAWP
ncbi:hypothetical protein PIB30_028613 [Stylosanthes scabra]|uniref:RRM domain-containing protein n=1 Tax=Stylosanthes scabra TaxID=79078 RepID=A0ABU6YBI8_9FABA|nr:hypothetical protein [Stylosanthes scabra]